jgi:multidrug efflux pump
MNISAPFIQRPVATSLLAIAVLLGGTLGYFLLPIASLPQVAFPTIQVTTQLPGASPDTIASLVTAPLERQLGQIPALQTMTSTSALGTSQVTLQFDLDRDIDGAAQDVQSAINAAASTLPRNLPYPPTYSKVNPADTPIMSLAITSQTIPLARLSDLADTLIAQRLSEVTGVGRVTVQGNIRPAVRIQADLPRLAGYGLGLEDIRTAITNSNANNPKGTFDGAQQAYTIGANDQLSTADAYRQVVVAYRNGAPVRLSDVARLIDGVENTRVAGWYNAEPAIVIDIMRQPGANIVQTVELIRRELPRLQRAVPAGARLQAVSDRTETIRASVRDVQFTLVLAVVLVVMVIFLFLRSLRATIIPGVALPLSIIATFGTMHLCGFSLDNLSLMALTIGTGFVVDDAIVMVENIVRHIEKGERPLEAAFRGAREIGFTIVSLTMSLIAVFIPILFMGGLVGRLFREFALTLTLAVVVSAVVSLTLTPMMCSRLLRAETGHHGRITRWADRGFELMLAFYRRTLEWVLRHQFATLLTTVGTLVATVLIYIVIPKGFLPLQDTSLIIATTEAGQAASFAEMQRLQEQIVAAIRRDPDVTGVVSLVGVGTVNPTPNAGRLAITLRSRDDRAASADDIATRLATEIAPIPGMTVIFQSVQDIQISTRPSRNQFQYTLVDIDSDLLALWSRRLVEQMRTMPALREVVSDLQDGGLRTLVRVNRDAAGRLGVSMQAIDDTLNDAFGQRQISTIFGQANQYRVILEADPQYQRDPSTLARLYVPGPAGTQVPLGSVATFERTTAALSIGREQQFPAVTISFNLPRDASLGEAIQAIAAAERAIGMPSEITGSFSGDAAEFRSSLAGQPWLVLAAVIAIYIVLGVLYESFVHPFTILTTLPSAGVGALLALIVCGQDLSLVAMIGIILLMGIVKKNAIMMIDFALEAERVGGMSTREAIVQASLMRFRPIMMTTLAALLGAVPLAFATGTGAELRTPLGVSIIGGLLLSQVLTLYTTPVIYLGMERLRAWLRPEAGALQPELDLAVQPAHPASPHAPGHVPASAPGAPPVK